MSDAFPQQLTDWPGLFSHHITNPEIIAAMETVRSSFLHTAQTILNFCPQTHYRSLAMTDLEAALLRAIQALAVHDLTARRDPCQEDPAVEQWRKVVDPSPSEKESAP